MIISFNFSTVKAQINKLTPLHVCVCVCVNVFGIILSTFSLQECGIWAIKKEWELFNIHK